MARSRFIKDAGLTARMTSVMFLLGALFVGSSSLMFVCQPDRRSSGRRLGIAFFQWYNSDTVAMKAMRAREVTPRAGARAARHDRPALRAGRHAQAAGRDRRHSTCPTRSPPAARRERAVVCVTTGILGRLTAEELEGVLAHELSHVAHRDVLVMTVASSAGIIAGMLTRGAQYGAASAGGRSRDNNGGLPVWLLVAAWSAWSSTRQLPADPDALALPRAVRRPGRRLPDR